MTLILKANSIKIWKENSAEYSVELFAFFSPNRMDGTVEYRVRILEERQ